MTRLTRSSRCSSGPREAGATSVGSVALHLRGEVREVFMGWLRDQRPDLVPRYEQLYRRGAYAPREERERLAGLVRGARAPRTKRFTRARAETQRWQRPPASDPSPTAGRSRRESAARQQSLF